MKIVMIYDQIQSGKGIKDDHFLPLGATKDTIGPAVMMEPYLKKIDGKIQACLYCGDEFFNENQEEVSRKLTAMVQKLQPDIVICGPCFNYLGYSKMAAYVANNIQQQTSIPAFAAMSVENNEVISNYKDKICIVKTPKKGGSGLNEALENMCLVAQKMSEGLLSEELKKNYCF